MFLEVKSLKICVAISKNKDILSGVCGCAVMYPFPGRSPEVRRAIQAVSVVHLHQQTDRVRPRRSRNPAAHGRKNSRRSAMAWSTESATNGSCEKELEKAQVEALEPNRRKSLSYRNSWKIPNGSVGRRKSRTSPPCKRSPGS